MLYSLKTIALTACALLLASCATLPLPQPAVGMLTGKLDVEWIGENSFIYRPDPSDPLTFVTSDGQKITPGLMFTDGGSIPPVLWSLPGFSPWGYAPAYIVHDWLFTQHHCHDAGWETVSFERSAAILGEVIETLMATNRVPRNEEARALIEAGVRTEVARNLWNTGDCKEPKRLLARRAGSRRIVLRLDYAR